MRERCAAKPSSFATSFWYDTLVYDPANLSLLAERAGADRLVIGTDYPFTIAEDPPGETLGQCPDITDADRARMRHPEIPRWPLLRSTATFERIMRTNVARRR
jgi:hypothetical protein